MRSISLLVSTDGPIPALGSDPVGALGRSRSILDTTEGAFGAVGPTVDDLLSIPRQLTDWVVL